MILGEVGDNQYMGQLSFFSRTELAAMRDRTRSRRYCPATEQFRREHERHRAWGLAQRHAEKLRRIHGGVPPVTAADDQRPDPAPAPVPPTLPPEQAEHPAEHPADRVVADHTDPAPPDRESDTAASGRARAGHHAPTPPPPSHRPANAATRRTTGHHPRSSAAYRSRLLHLPHPAGCQFRQSPRKVEHHPNAPPAEHFSEYALIGYLSTEPGSVTMAEPEAHMRPKAA
ncbi:hypothetical protein AB0M46_40630 [Dactylosporangium sp. NPDC051485]|uniref:hypothetical protein n=1 Tax=Dactylosporangium sp. NPDC051485 TaxID=3154846 RepID=UPI0034379A36